MSDEKQYNNEIKSAKELVENLNKVLDHGGGWRDAEPKVKIFHASAAMGVFQTLERIEKLMHQQLDILERIERNQHLGHE